MTPAELIDTIEFSPVPPPDKQTAPFVMVYPTHRGQLRIGNAILEASILSNGKLVFYGDALHAFLLDVHNALTQPPANG